MDEAQKTKLMADCTCGSGKKYGECHGQEEMCFCGSGNMAKDCCMKSPETHGVDQPAASNFLQKNARKPGVF